MKAKRLLALLLTFCMVLGLLPVGVFAAGNATVTYAAGEGTGAAVNGGEHTYGEAITAPNAILEGFTAPDGKELGGWLRSDNGQILQPGDVFNMPAENVVLTAQWREKDKTYTVTYANSAGLATGVTEADVAQYTPVLVKDTTGAYLTVDSDKEFLAWQRSDTNDYILPGQSFNMPAMDVVLTAVLVDKSEDPADAKYTIIFNYANGMEADAFSGKPAGTYTVQYDPTTNTKLSYADHEFLGWKIDDQDSLLQKGDKYQVTGNTTLTAVWEEIVPDETYTVSFNYYINKEAQTKQYLNVTKGTHTIPTDLGQTREGYNFLGWEIDGKDDLLQDGQSYEVTSDMVITAQWEETPAEYVAIIFHPNGGQLVGYEDYSTIYWDYEKNEAIGDMPNAELAGHTFLGWYNAAEGGDKVEPETIVVNPATLYAHYEPTSYVVTFNAGSDVGSSMQTVKYGETATYYAPTREGYTFDGWYKDQDCTVIYGFATPVTKDIQLYAKWLADEVTLTYEASGATFDVKTAYVGGNYVLPDTDPTVPGYTFTGWYTDEGKKIIADEIVPAGLTDNKQTLEAHWSYDPWTVTFIQNGGTYVPTQKVNDGDTVAKPAISREGYTFGGWFDNAATEAPKFAFDTTPITGNITLYAKWTPETRTVTFKVNGATYATRTVDYDTALGSANQPGNPTEDGYTFGGWYTDPEFTNQFDFNGAITEDTVVYGKLVANEYTVTFDVNGGDALAVNSKKVTFGKTYGELPKPTMTGMNFAGWFTSTDDSGTAVNEATPVTEKRDHMLYAHWSDQTVIVTVNTGDDTIVIHPFTRAYGDPIGLMEVERDGYTLVGWVDKDGYPVNLGAGLTGDITITAVWSKNSSVVVFDPNAGDATGTMDAQTFQVDQNQQLNVNQYAREGYVFKGWSETMNGAVQYVDGVTIPFSKSVTLYAVWQAEKRTVNFETNGGTAVPAQDVDYGARASVPTAPTKTGYALEGWYQLVDGEYVKYYFTEPVTENITLYANWDADSYQVTFNSNGGSAVAPQPVKHGEKATKPEDPTREGYDFDGWYLGTNLYNFDDPVTGSGTLDAKWVPTTYTISYNLDGGAITGEPTSYTVEDDTFPIPTPTRAGYTFEGWTGTGLNGKVKAVTIAKGSTGNRTYTANWTADPAAALTVTVDPDTEEKITYGYGEAEAPELAVKVTAPTEGYDLSYAWYYKDKNESHLIENAEQNHLHVVTGLPVGRYYVYCVVTATRKDNGEKATAQTGDFTITVEPKEIGLSWYPTEFNYDGNAHCPGAKATGLVAGDEVNVTVTGGKTNAGTYVATATGLTGAAAGNYTLPADDAAKTGFTINKIDPVVYAPTAVDGLVYDGTAHVLLNAGAAEGGTMYYSVQKDDGFTTSLPVGTVAGEYVLYYSVMGDANHNNAGPFEVKANIKKAELDDLAVSIDNWTYGKTANDPSVTGYAGDPDEVVYRYKLADAGDETYQSTQPTDAGTYTVRADAPPTDDYLSGTATSNFTIFKAEASFDPRPEGKNLEYNGELQTLVRPGRSSNGTIYYKLGEDGEYGIAVPTASEPGTYTIYYKIVGDKNHNDSGEHTLTATISKLDISMGNVTIAEPVDMVYTGEAITQDIVVAYEAGDVDPVLLKEGVDYEVFYVNNVNVGEASVTISGINNCIGAAYKTFKINPATILNAKVTQKGELEYTGNLQIPEVEETAETKGDQPVTFTYSLTENGTYGPMPAFKDAGSVTVYFKASAPNHNDVIGTFIVTIGQGAASINAAPSARDLTYTGKAMALVDAGNASSGTMVYSLDGENFSTTIPTGTDAGTYRVWFKAQGDDNTADSQAGYVDVTIKQRDMKDVTVEAIADATYKGSRWMPKPAAAYNGIALAETTDFTYDWGENISTPTGSVTLTATENGNYTGSKTVYFAIRQNGEELTVKLDTSSYVYDGQPKYPGIISVYDANNNKLNADQYDVYYINNVDVGTAKVYVVGKGDYQGNGIAEFTITKAQPALAVTMDDWTYGGEPKEPVVTGNPGNAAVTIWYTDVDGNELSGVPTDAGTYKVYASIEGTDNYTAATASDQFVINQKPINPEITLADYTLVYNGQAQTPAVRVVDPETSMELTPGTDFQVVYSNNIDAGTAHVRVTANSSGNYVFREANLEFTIEQLEVVLKWGDLALPYTGLPQKPTVTVDEDKLAERDKGKVTVEAVATDLYHRPLTVEGYYIDPTEPGYYGVTAIGLNNSNYKLPLQPWTYYQIIYTTISLADNSITVKIQDPSTFEYDGTEHEPTVIVLKDGKTPLIKDQDYTVSYINNVNAGTASVVVTGIGHYTGTKTADFTINQRIAEIEWGETRFFYNGKPQKPTATVSNLVDGDACEVTVGTYQNGAAVPAQNAGGVEADKYWAQADALSNPNYKLPDPLPKTEFAIMKAELSAEVEADVLTYNGEEQTPNVRTRYITVNTVEDPRENDATFKYSLVKEGPFIDTLPTFKDAGDYVVYFEATAPNHDPYPGVFHVIVQPKDVAGADFTAWLEYETTEYTGTPRIPAVGVADGNNVLNNPNDYTVAYDHNVDVGTAYVYVNGQGNYGGVRVLTFQITPKSITDNNDVTVTVANGPYYYTGSEIEPDVTVKIGDKELVEGEDYTVSYQDNVNAGSEAKVIVNGIGNYTGSKQENFEILKAQNEVTVVGLELPYNGKPQQLVRGTAKFGKILYSETSDGTFTSEIPTKTEPGEYTFYYKVMKTDNYTGVDTTAVTGKIFGIGIENHTLLSDEALVTFENDYKTAVVTYDDNGKKLACVVAIHDLDSDKYTRLYGVKSGDNTYTFDLSGATGNFKLAIAVKGDADLDGYVDSTDVGQVTSFANKKVTAPAKDTLTWLVIDTDVDDYVDSTDVGQVTVAANRKAVLAWDEK